MDAPTIAMAKTAELETREPFRGLFPANRKLTDAIADDMRDRGYDPTWPIAAWGGVVVDGHTRLAAARQARLTLVPVAMHHFPDEAAALEYAIKCQTNRRNLSDEELLRCWQELDKRRQSGERTDLAQPCARSPEDGRAPKSAAATAELLGISQRKGEQIRTVLDHAPEPVKEAVQAGNMSINAAYKATQEARREAEPPKPEPPRHQPPPGPHTEPCPHCETPDPAVDHNQRRSAYYVRCDGCGMQGPTGDDEEDAADLWNGLPRRV